MIDFSAFFRYCQKPKKEFHSYGPEGRGFESLKACQKYSRPIWGGCIFHTQGRFEPKVAPHIPAGPAGRAFLTRPARIPQGVPINMLRFAEYEIRNRQICCRFWFLTSFLYIEKQAAFLSKFIMIQCYLIIREKEAVKNEHYKRTHYISVISLCGWVDSVINSLPIT